VAGNSLGNDPGETITSVGAVMRRFMVIVFSLIFLMGVASVCSAASQTVEVTADGQNISVCVNGIPVNFDQAPYIANDRMMVPVRFVSEALGAQVSWDSETQTIIITADKVIELQIGSTKAMKDGSPITLDAPAEIAGERTIVPLRFVSEALGAQVIWQQVRQSVTSVSSSSPSQFVPDAVITKDQTWSGEVYINKYVQVPTGVTLTIEPGTKIKFRHYRGYKEPEERCGLEISGTLKAIGTPERQIIFTSDASGPVNGDWHMLRLMNASDDSIIKYAVVEFAQQGINIWNCSPLISHTVVRWNNWEGIYLESYCKPIIEYNLICENGYNGIAMEQFNDAIIRYNTIMRSGTHGIHIDASTAHVEHNLLKENKASGLSVDDNGTLIAYDNTIENNTGPDIDIGEGINKVTAKGNLYKNNGGGINPSPGNEVEDIPGSGAGTLLYDYTAPADYKLGYIPGDSLNDRYMYVYPNDETRQIVKKIGEGLGLTWSLASDGQYIWTAALWGDVYKLDPDTGEIKTHWIFPGPQAWGMTYDGEHLWINDFAEKRVYEMDLDGKVLSSFAVPDQTGGAKGITWDGNYLYILGWTSSTIYQVDRKGNLIDTITIQNGGVGGGLTWDGNYFWAPGGKGIAKIDKQGRIVGGIYAASEGTWDLAWDGSYLWACQRTNENWQDAKIFKLKILNDAI